MSKVSVKFAELHTPLFLNGILGQKLSPASRTGMILTWDEDKNHLVVIYKGDVAFIPSTNVQSWSPTNPADVGIEFPKPALVAAPALPTLQSEIAAKGVKTAQVSHPAQPAEGVQLGGKPKVISHAQLKAHLDTQNAENKDRQ